MDLTYNEPVVGIIRPANHNDCLVVGHHLREQDKLEIYNYDRSLPVEAVTNSYNQSEIKMTIEKDGVPICLFGIMIVNNLPVLWLFSTDGLSKIGRNLVRNTKIWFYKMLDTYSILYGMVDLRNKESIRWLTYVGVEWSDITLEGIDKMPFRHFQFKKKD